MQPSEITTARIAKGLSKYRLAKMLEVSYQTILMYERGLFKPSAERLAKLKVILGVDKQV